MKKLHDLCGVNCYHCGDECSFDAVVSKGHTFCCTGCETVYGILQENNLDEYYKISNFPGVRNKNSQTHEEEINEEFIDEVKVFENDSCVVYRFFVPQIHCSSCLWLLDGLDRLDDRILSSNSGLSNKMLEVRVKPEMSAQELFTLLSRLGYRPDLLENKKSSSANKRLLIKIGIAGFSFGNIMLLSFPEYLGFDSSFGGLQWIFNYLNWILTLPVVLYACKDYLVSAWNAIKTKRMSIDVPISIGIVTLFVRSSVDVFMGYGPGFSDSLAGFTFFLLIGKWFQQKTFDSMSFERDFRSFFPISVYRRNAEGKELTSIKELEEGDIIEIRNEEVIPTDGILESNAIVDYSFVTGEKDLTHLQKGSHVFAGGKVKGKMVVIQCTKEVDNSRLTSLWNESSFKKKDEVDEDKQLDKVVGFFVLSIILIALASGIYWWYVDPSAVFPVVSSVLIVACPCGLSLSGPFSYGTGIRILGEDNIYFKNIGVLRRLSKINRIVFDKTGTLTYNSGSSIRFKGKELTQEEKDIIYSVTSNSMHPVSQMISKNIKGKMVALEDFKESAGFGIEAIVGGKVVRLGRSEHVLTTETAEIEPGSFVKIDNEVLGCFIPEYQYREGLLTSVNELKKDVKLDLLSGDNDSERDSLSFFGFDRMLFNQKPKDKMEYLKSLKAEGNQVMMVGDGLNDSGALKESDVGVAVVDDIHQFSPACDAILEGEKLFQMPEILAFSRRIQRVVKWSIVLSLLYNCIGLTFAVTGSLSPIVAAILMPLSSISIVIFTVGLSRLYAAKSLT